MNTTAVSLSDLHPNSHRCGQSCRRRSEVIVGSWVNVPCDAPVTRALVDVDGRVVLTFCTRCVPKVSSWSDEVDHLSIVEVER